MPLAPAPETPALLAQARAWLADDPDEVTRAELAHLVGRAEARDEDHLVARVYQRGYVFGGQLLRPARVVVKQYNG